jgi:hypothetical protein
MHAARDWGWSRATLAGNRADCQGRFPLHSASGLFGDYSVLLLSNGTFCDRLGGLFSPAKSPTPPPRYLDWRESRSAVRLGFPAGSVPAAIRVRQAASARLRRHKIRRSPCPDAAQPEFAASVLSRPPLSASPHCRGSQTVSNETIESIERVRFAILIDRGSFGTKRCRAE